MPPCCKGGAFLETLILLLAVFGAVILLTARLPMLLRDLPSSLPIACIALGALPHVPVLSPLLDRTPLKHLKLTEGPTESVAIMNQRGQD